MGSSPQPTSDDPELASLLRALNDADANAATSAGGKKSALHAAAFTAADAGYIAWAESAAQTTGRKSHQDRYVTTSDSARHYAEKHQSESAEHRFFEHTREMLDTLGADVDGLENVH